MTQHNPPTSKLLSETLILLRDVSERHSLREIADGAAVGYEWVRALKYRSIRSPGVEKVERLNRHLSDLAAADRVAASRSA